MPILKDRNRLRSSAVCLHAEKENSTSGLLADACKAKHNQVKYSALESDMIENKSPGPR